MAQINLYVTTWCPYCEQAKQLLQSLDASWEETNIEQTGMTRAELAELTGGFTVPQIVIDGQPIGGYDDLYTLNLSGGLQDLLQD